MKPNTPDQSKQHSNASKQDEQSSASNIHQITQNVSNMRVTPRGMRARCRITRGSMRGRAAITRGCGIKRGCRITRGGRGTRGGARRARNVRRYRNSSAHRGGRRSIKSTKKWCCFGDGKEKSVYFTLYDNIALNPTLLDPRLNTVGYKVGYHYLEPDRRGLSQFHVKHKQFHGNNVIRRAQCIKDVCGFIRKHCNIATPTRITCRISQLYEKVMHMHVHYNRSQWIQIIEADKLNIYACDIADRDTLHSLFAIIDIYKHCYSQKGSDFYMQYLQDMGLKDDNYNTLKQETVENEFEGELQTKKNDEDNEANNKENEPKDEMENKMENDIEKIRTEIEKIGFKFSNTEPRIWKQFCVENVDIEKEICLTISMLEALKHINCDFDLFFKDQRFGLDMESRTAFIEIRPRGFFLLYNAGKLKAFKKKFKMMTKQRLRNTEMKLKADYGEAKVKEVTNYALSFFETHPEIFAWHRTKH